MEFRLLGPLEVLDGDAPVALGGLKQRALLARLLVSPNRAVAVDRLIDDCGARLPRDRRQDGPDLRLAAAQAAPAEALVTRPPGYLVAVDAEAIDTGRFDRLRRDGPRGARGGRSGDRRRAAARGARPVARRGARGVHRAVRAGRARPPRRAAPALPRGPHRRRPAARPPRGAGRRVGAEARASRCASACAGSRCSRCTAAAGTPTRSPPTRTSAAGSTTTWASSRRWSSATCNG